LQSSYQAKRDELLHLAYWLYADLCIIDQEFTLAEDSLERGKAVKQPVTLSEFEWLADKFISIATALQSDGGNRTSVGRLLEKAEAYKPALNEHVNQLLVRYWADNGRTDSKAMSKYFQVLPKQDLLRARFRNVIYEACKIDAKSNSHNLQGRIDYNQQLTELYDTLEWPYRNLGHGYLHQQEYEQSAGYFAEAQSVSGAPHYGFWIGKAFYLSGDYKKSREVFASLSEEVKKKYVGEYELWYGLTLAQLLLNGTLRDNIQQQEELAAHNLKAAIECFKGDESPAQFAEACFFAGIIKFKQKQFNEALPLLQTAVENDPFNSRYLAALAETLGKMGRVQDAVICFKKAILYGEDQEQNAERMVAIGDILHREGSGDAGPWYTLAEKKCPEHPLVLIKLAQTHLADEQFSEAREKALKISAWREKLQYRRDEIIPEMHFILGRCSVRFREFTDAQEHLEQALSFGRSTWDTHYWLGMSLAHRQDYDAAREKLETALSLPGDHPRTYIQMGNIVLLQGNKQIIPRAIDYFAGALGLLTPEQSAYVVEAVYGLGACYQILGNSQEAKYPFHYLLAIDPHHVAARYELAIIYEDEQDVDKCEEQLRAIIDSHTETAPSAYVPRAMVKLGILLCKKSVEAAYREAEILFDRARDLGQENDDVGFYRGLIEIETGRVEQGYNRWMPLYEKNKNNHTFQENLGKASYLLGIERFRENNFNEAASLFQQSGAYLPASFKEQLQLNSWIAGSYYQNGRMTLSACIDKAQPPLADIEKADELFAKALTINNNLPDALLARAICALYRGKEHLAEAEQFLSQVLEQYPTNVSALFLNGVKFLLEGENDKQAQAYDWFNRLLAAPNAQEFEEYDLARFMICCEEVNRDNGAAMDSLLQLLEKQHVVRRMPFSSDSFCRWLTGRLLKQDDQNTENILENLDCIHASSGMFQHALALCNSVMGKIDQALKHFSAVYQKDSGSRIIAEEFSRHLCFRATIHVAKDRYQEAMRDLQQAKLVLSGK